MIFAFFAALAPQHQAWALDDMQDQVQANLIAPADQGVVIRALKAARQGQWREAQATVGQAEDALARDIVSWMVLRQDSVPAGFSPLAAFIERRPQWPEVAALRLKAEKTMPDGLPAEDVVAFFAAKAPATAPGMERYLKALLNQGARADAEEALRAWWPTAAIDQKEQRYFISLFGGLLDRETHVKRFNQALYKKQYTNARALAQTMGRGYPALAEARIALAEGKPGTDRLIAAVPSHLGDDPGLMLERIKWRRRNNNDFGAIELLHAMPDPQSIPNVKDWWDERHVLVRRLMEKKQFDSAYLLAAGHGLSRGQEFAQAEFIAGWLALKTERPDKAFQHFEQLYLHTVTPLSRSRGAYWAARASAALGYADVSKQWYQVAARYQTAFYGQMAVGALEPEDRPPQQVPPALDVGLEQTFRKRDMVQAATLLQRAGLKKEVAQFLDTLSAQVDDPEEYLLVARLAEDLDHYHNAVKIAKKGIEKNIVLTDHAFPTMLPRMTDINLEWALVHGLIRQESQFDFDARSSAGALGLMQLMPATAREVAHKKGWGFSLARLTSDPDYNIRIGSSYLNQLINRYDGSYPLALAAYNAGPGRVDGWLKTFGDPRTGAIDLIDWIEMIPIYETRNYVQRVMESTYIYRMKMKGVQRSFNAPLHVALR